MKCAHIFANIIRSCTHYATKMEEALEDNLKQLSLDTASEEIFNKLAVLCSVVGLLGPLG